MQKPFMNMISSSFALLLAGTLSVYAEQTLPPEPKIAEAVVYEEGKAGMFLVDMIEVSAKVLSIDTDNRKLKLLGPDGKSFDVKVGPEAKKFDKIKINDVISITLGSELDIKVYKNADVVPAIVANEGVLGESDQQPGFVAAERITITAEVIEIDKERYRAKLKFKDGRTQTFAVRMDVDLNQHNVGEVVVFTFTEAAAINVENIEK